jgi:hypothetical protein
MTRMHGASGGKNESREPSLIACLHALSLFSSSARSSHALFRFSSHVERVGERTPHAYANAQTRTHACARAQASTHTYMLACMLARMVHGRFLSLLFSPFLAFPLLPSPSSLSPSVSVLPHSLLSLSPFSLSFGAACLPLQPDSGSGVYSSSSGIGGVNSGGGSGGGGGGALVFFLAGGGPILSPPAPAAAHAAAPPRLPCVTVCNRPAVARPTAAAVVCGGAAAAAAASTAAVTAAAAADARDAGPAGMEVRPLPPPPSTPPHPHTHSPVLSPP